MLLHVGVETYLTLLPSEIKDMGFSHTQSATLAFIPH